MTMEVQDYEYYEAHAKDIKLEDITSEKDNADLLARLRDNDPHVYQISITKSRYERDFVLREGDHLGWLGYFVGKSKQLETLTIESFPETISLNAFLEGLGHNQSIQYLFISRDLGESFQSLIPFVRNNDSLRHLSFNDFDIGLQCVRNITLLLSQNSSLKRLEIDETDLDVEGLVEVITAVRAHTQIEELSLTSNYNLGREGFAELGRMLEGWRSPRLSFLDVMYSDIDDEGLYSLVAGLRNCHNLTSLTLHGNRSITEAGWRSLSALFQSDNCRLECLDLGRMNIDDEEVSILAPGIASLSSLRHLDLFENSIGDQGIQALVGALVSCNIEELCLSNNHFTTNVMTSLSSLFRGEHCALYHLWLYGTHLGDGGAAVLADGLIGNMSLTTLNFKDERITASGWAAFSELLCDTSSVNNTYLSNHTLVEVGEPAYKSPDTPQEIMQYLKWNKSHNQTAAICKILRSHPDIDIKPLLQFNLKCLPFVVAWLEKAKSYRAKVKESTEVFHSRQLSAVYKFIRGMPQLAVDGYRKEKTKDIQSDAKKRKFDLTL